MVEAVRYHPRHVDLLLACGADQPEVPAVVARWWADTRARPRVVTVTAAPHAAVGMLAARAAAWFGPTASAIVRWLAGAFAAAADHGIAVMLERPLRARIHPGLLVPHLHEVAVVAVDMRGFSNLTRVLHDTQYLTDLVAEYLTELTRVVESHRGIVFQYTGDGLLALFLPELAGVGAAPLMRGVVDEVAPALHHTFDALHRRWRSAWQLEGRPEAEIGLGVGLSFGRATIGFIGPAGKKQFGAIGEPVNVAALLCAEAVAGMVLIDRGSFTRAGIDPTPGRVVRLRRTDPHQQIEAVCLSEGDHVAAGPAARLSEVEVVG
jgi:class 3 adenylate cyclase